MSEDEIKIEDVEDPQEEETQEPTPEPETTVENPEDAPDPEPVEETQQPTPQETAQIPYEIPDELPKMGNTINLKKIIKSNTENLNIQRDARKLYVYLTAQRAEREAKQLANSVPENRKTITTENVRALFE